MQRRISGSTSNPLLAQTYQDWATLPIDGGSTDNRAELCREYCRQGSQIRLVGQENRRCTGGCGRLKFTSQRCGITTEIEGTNRRKASQN